MSEETENQDLDEAAARWLARREDAETWTSSDEESLQEWLASSPEHQGAFEAAQRAFGVMGEAKVFPEGEVDRFLRSSKQSRPLLFRPALWLPIAAAAVVALGFLFAFSFEKEPELRSFATAVGEMREFVLPDGTRASLDSRTRIEYRFEGGSRSIELLSGAAVFEVAPDPDRPFEVRAGAYTIRDIGTIFSVRHLLDLNRNEMSNTPIEVAVEEGIVDMSPSHGAASERPSTIRLRAGEKATWTYPRAKATLEKFDLSVFASWRENRLRYRDRPLSEVLADLQRYHEGAITLLDSDLGELRVTGTLRNDDLPAAVAALEAILPIDIQVGDQGQMWVREARR